jgi:hypothetical protein
MVGSIALFGPDATTPTSAVRADVGFSTISRFYSPLDVPTSHSVVFDAQSVFRSRERCSGLRDLALQRRRTRLQ